MVGKRARSHRTQEGISVSNEEKRCVPVHSEGGVTNGRRQCNSSHREKKVPRHSAIAKFQVATRDKNAETAVRKIGHINSDLE